MAFEIFIPISEYRITSEYAELTVIAILTIHLELSQIKVILQFNLCRLYMEYEVLILIYQLK
jgi:hypothetical protein